jgi:hypothetical protein
MSTRSFAHSSGNIDNQDISISPIAIQLITSYSPILDNVARRSGLLYTLGASPSNPLPPDHHVQGRAAQEILSEPAHSPLIFSDPNRTHSSLFASPASRFAQPICTGRPLGFTPPGLAIAFTIRFTIACSCYFDNSRHRVADGTPP